MCPPLVVDTVKIPIKGTVFPCFCFYRQSDAPSIKLKKLNTFTYSFFKSEYGCKEPKQKLVKRKEKDPEKKI